jgi:hypothetical protein
MFVVFWLRIDSGSWMRNCFVWTWALSTNISKVDWGNRGLIYASFYGELKSLSWHVSRSLATSKSPLGVWMGAMNSYSRCNGKQKWQVRKRKRWQRWW